VAGSATILTTSAGSSWALLTVPKSAFRYLYGSLTNETKVIIASTPPRRRRSRVGVRRASRAGELTFFFRKSLKRGASSIGKEDVSRRGFKALLVARHRRRDWASCSPKAGDETRDEIGDWLGAAAWISRASRPDHGKGRNTASTAIAKEARRAKKGRSRGRGSSARGEPLFVTPEAGEFRIGGPCDGAGSPPPPPPPPRGGAICFALDVREIMATIGSPGSQRSSPQ